MKIFKPVFHSVIALTLCLSLSSCDNTVIKEKWDSVTQAVNNVWNDLTNTKTDPPTQEMTKPEPEPEPETELTPTPDEYFNFILRDDGTYAVSAKTTDMPSKVIIPDTYQDIPITLVKNDGFSGCESIKSIIFPKYLSVIDSGVIRGCPTLKSISVKKGNKNFHSDGNCIIHTFTKTIVVGCKTSVIPTDHSVRGIGDYAFSVGSPANMVIPDNILFIGNGAFYCNEHLESITCSDRLGTIGLDAFRGCTNLKRVSLGSGIISIQEHAFASCRSLESIVIPEGVKSIGSSTFAYCDNLSYVSLPESLIRINGGAFYKCTSLKSIDLPSNLSTIDKSAFYGCTALTKIIIPDSVKKIGVAAFENCTSLIAVVLGNTVEVIPDDTFLGCSKLEAVIASHYLTEINPGAFEGCPNVEIIIY